MSTKNKQPPRRSRQAILSRALNLLLWLSFCAMAGTGFLLSFRLPPGSRGGHGLTALGLNRHEWGDVHSWLGYFFIITILTHLALHWRWLWQIAPQTRLADVARNRIRAHTFSAFDLSVGPVRMKPAHRDRRADFRLTRHHSLLRNPTPDTFFDKYKS